MLVHHLVDFVHCQTSVHALHGLAGLVHGQEGFLVDVGCFCRVHMLLELHYLRLCLFEVLFVKFLSSECGFGNYNSNVPSALG